MPTRWASVTVTPAWCLRSEAGRGESFGLAGVDADRLVEARAGMFAFNGTPRLLAVAVVTLGALADGFKLVWTFVMPILALALVVLFARGALRGPSVAPAPVN